MAGARARSATARVLGGVAALAMAPPSPADFTHVEIRDVSAEVGAPAGYRTWRVFALGTNHSDRFLAVGGHPGVLPVAFDTNDPVGLHNDGGFFAGTKSEDFAAAPIAKAWDSWVSLGPTMFAGNDTDYSPAFLNNDGVVAVIVGSSWSDTDEGWFDSEPGTPEFGPEIVIAQFTVRHPYHVRLSGTVTWQPDPGEYCADAFCAISPNFSLCPLDRDGDADVGFDELLLVLAGWGACASACPADLDGDLLVDDRDLDLVLDAWGPCPAPGACCLPDGACVTADDCQDAGCAMLGGLYAGLGTTCADVACAPAACCFPDGTCTQQFAPQCAIAGGVAQGSGTTCDDRPCPPTACCLLDGSCEQRRERECLADGGVFQGPDTSCAELACPQPGACCLVDGSCEQSDPGGLACAAVGGVYDGDDSLCAAVTCVPPRCRFAPQVVYPGGDEPRDIVAADFDGDGDLDLALVNPGTGSVRLFRNDGSGAFGFAGLEFVGAEPRKLAAADLDGNGRPDLVVSNSGDASLSVLLGDGTGGFFPAVHLDVGDEPRGVALGDLDGDRHADIVVANLERGDLSVLINAGDGTFRNEMRFDSGPAPTRVALGDLDADGDLDAVVTNLDFPLVERVTVLANDGTGQLAVTADYDAGSPFEVAIGDLDGDLDPDLAVASVLGDELFVLLNDGAGVFAPGGSFAAGFSAGGVVLGDFDGDDDLDAAISNWFDGTVSTLLNDGAAVFLGELVDAAGVRPNSMAAGDFDGDGDLDLVVANANSEDVSVLLNDCGDP